MKEKELKSIYRYDKEKKAFNIDIHLNDYRDVYSDWDYAPFVNRDLDEDLLEYLMSCSYEISKKYNVLINFFLSKNICDLSREGRSIEGIHNYFLTKIRQTRSERYRLIRNTFLFFIIGTILLVSAELMDKIIQDEFFKRIISEGLFIGAWVAIWEIFSIWFFQVNNLGLKIRHYYRLHRSPITYYYKD